MTSDPTGYTYDDLARYLDAVRRFTVFDIPYNSSVFGIIRSRVLEADLWDTTYIPVIKRN